LVLKRFALVVLSILMVFAFAACGDETADEVDAVAVVNGEEILREDFDQIMEQVKEMYEMQGMDLEEDEEMLEEIKHQLVDEMISELLLLQKAEEENITADQEIVEEQVEAIKAQFDSDEEMEQALAMYNIDPDNLEEEISNAMVIEELMDSMLNEEEIEVTEEELRELYDQQVAMMGDPEDEDADIPEFEEMKPQLEEMAVQDKMQQQTGSVIEELKEDSEIEILLET